MKKKHNKKEFYPENYFYEVAWWNGSLRTHCSFFLLSTTNTLSELHHQKRKSAKQFSCWSSKRGKREWVRERAEWQWKENGKYLLCLFFGCIHDVEDNKFWNKIMVPTIMHKVLSLVPLLLFSGNNDEAKFCLRNITNRILSTLALSRFFRENPPPCSAIHCPLCLLAFRQCKPRLVAEEAAANAAALCYNTYATGNSKKNSAAT